MRHLLVLLVVLCTPLATWADGPDTSASEAKMKLETIQVGRGRPSAKSLGISPTIDRTSRTGYFTPQNLAEAIVETKTMLPRQRLLTILSESGADSDIYERDSDFRSIATWMYQNWSLEGQNSKLGSYLRTQGFMSVEWMAAAVFEAIYEDSHHSESSMIRFRRVAFLEQEDERPPLTAFPSECASPDSPVKDGFIKLRDYWIGNSRRPFGRTIYWVNCKNGSMEAYLWEREWFAPNDELSAEIRAQD
jgi:hypothetical protein